MQLSIRARMLIFIAAPIIILYLLSDVYNTIKLQSWVKSSVENRMSTLAESYASKFDAQLREVAMVGEATATFMENVPNLNDSQIYNQLHHNIGHTPFIYGGVICFEPYKFNPEIKLYCPYVYRGVDRDVSKGFSQMELGAEGYDYTDPQWEWWHAPRHNKESIWTEPFFDEGAGNILMSTYSVPFYKDGDFYGVTTIDISLASLQQDLKLADDDNIRFSVISEKGTFIYNSKLDYINKNITELASQNNNNALIDIATQIDEQKTGFIKAKKWNQRDNQWLFFTQVPSTGWTFIVEIDASYALATVNESINDEVVLMMILLMVVLVIIFITSKHFSKPILELNRAAKQMVAKHTSVKQNRNAPFVNDEITSLTNSFNEMSAAIDKQLEVIEIKNQQALANLALYQGLYQESTEGIFKCRLNGEYIHANPAYRKMLALRDKDDLSLCNFQKDASFDKEMFNLLLIDENNTSLDNYEFPLQRYDGSNLWVSLSLRAVQENGEYVFEGSARDISNRMERDQIEKDKLKAEASTEAKSLFLANMSHEIRTPMNAIIGMSYLALKNDSIAKKQSYIQKVHQAGESLLAIINDILDFSKIEAGKLTLEKTEFNLRELLDDLNNMTGLAAETKGIELVFATPSNLPNALIGDPTRLNQILINLTSNAIKFTEHGHVLVKVEANQISNGKIELDFSVQDTGIGMTEMQQQQLFKAFSQADETITRKHGGTGLGLSISQKLIELMGGNIELSSELGLGSCFSFQLTLDVAAHSITPQAVVQDQQLKGMRILAVDDSQIALTVIEGILLEEGAEVVCVNSAEQAYQKLQTGDAYDIVLMDWCMPEVNGIDATRTINAKEFMQNPPVVIMVTAHQEELIKDEATAAGVDNFVFKPVNPNVLLASIKQSLGKQRTESKALVTDNIEEIAKQQLQGKSVLLVEDNEINIEIALELLSLAGLKVDIAKNGVQAVAKLQNYTVDNNYDVVLMDLQMPEMDGYKATEIIRNELQIDKLPIIAMTAYAMDSEKQKCLEAGMNDHVSKPIKPTVLYQTLINWLSNQTTNDSINIDLDPAGIIISSQLEQEKQKTPSELDKIELDFLDIEAGLSNVNGNKALYQKLLTQFYNANQEGATEIDKLLSSGKIDEVKARLHTLKGLTGTLGMLQHSKIVESFEKAMQQGRDIEVADQRFVAEFEYLIASLKPYIEQWQQQSSQAVMTDDSELSQQQIKAAEAVVDQLKQALTEGSAKSSVLFLELKKIIGDTNVTINTLEQEIDNFNFDAALEQLQQIADELKT